MESGLFNNVIKIDNYVIKISKNDSDIASQIMKEMNSGTPDEYAKRINDVGIKTPKIISIYKYSKYNILIQEFIDGMTIQEILNNPNIDVNIKIDIFDKLIDLYCLSEKDGNLCLDWNMKNFVVKNDDIYYVDLTPCLYKNIIIKCKSENLLQYKESYLNKKIQLAGILGYAIIPFIKHKSRNEAKEIYKKIVSILNKKLLIDFDNLTVNYQHVYFYKLLQINKYLNSNISQEEMNNNINSYSMEKISKYPEKETSFNKKNV